MWDSVSTHDEHRDESPFFPYCWILLHYTVSILLSRLQGQAFRARSGLPSRFAFCSRRIIIFPIHSNERLLLGYHCEPRPVAASSFGGREGGGRLVDYDSSICDLHTEGCVEVSRALIVDHHLTIYFLKAGALLADCGHLPINLPHQPMSPEASENQQGIIYGSNYV